MGRRINYVVFAVMATVLLGSCKYSKEYKTINADNKFTISIPPWMDKQDNLKPGAQFQYANRFRNFYAIATATDKTELKRTFDEVLHDNVSVVCNALTKPVVSDSTNVTINGLKGVRMEVFGKMSDEPIYFSEVLLQSDTRIYHISVWTRGQERKSLYKADIDKIINSFNEVK